MGKTVATLKPANPFANQTVARGLERVAWLMDRAIKIPGTKINVGLDALLGLVPLGGDVVAGFVQVGLVLVALGHYRVPKAVAVRMIGNVVIDVACGAIPILGDLFDVVFKANTRNLKLLEPYLPRETIDLDAVSRPQALTIDRSPEPGGMPWRYLLAIAAFLLGFLVLVIIGFVTVVRWLIS